MKSVSLVLILLGPVIAPCSLILMQRLGSWIISRAWRSRLTKVGPFISAWLKALRLLAISLVAIVLNCLILRAVSMLVMHPITFAVFALLHAVPLACIYETAGVRYFPRPGKEI